MPAEQTLIGHCLVRDLPPARADWLVSRLKALRPEDWQALTAAADGMAVLPAWCAGLQARGLLGYVPEPVRDALTASLLLNRERNALLRAQAQDLSDCLAQIDCPAVYLKGMGHILGGTYAERGARLTSDIDVLVPRERIEEAGRQMFACGYRVEAAPDQLDLTVSEFNHHLAPMRRDGELAETELHYAFLSHRAAPIPSADILAKAVQPDAKSPILVPSPTHAAGIAVMHATLRQALLQGHHLKMRDMMDFVAVTERGEVDASALIAGFRAVGAAPELGGFLYAVQKVMGADLGDPALADLAQRHADHGQRMLAGRARMTALAPLYYDSPGLLRWGLSVLTSKDFRRHLLRMLRDPAYRQQRRAYLASARGRDTGRDDTGNPG